MAGLRREHRKGNAAFTAVSIIALLSFATLTVDIGHARMTRAQLQNAVDAAAHAAVADIDKSAQGLIDARAAAKYVGGLNKADGSSVVLVDSDIVFGIYDWGTGAFTAGESPVASVNAVVVTHQKLDIDAIFALVSFGEDTLGARAASMAVVPEGTPASAVDCFMPLAVPACRIMQAVDSNNNGVWDKDTESPIAALDFVTSSSNDDNAAWAALDATASDAFFQGQFAGDDCQGASLEDNPMVSLNNGSHASVYSTLDDLLTTGSTSYKGDTVTSDLLGTWDNEYWNGYNAPPTFDERMLPQDCDGDGRDSEKDPVVDAADCDGDGIVAEVISEGSSTSEFGGASASSHSRWGQTLQGPIMLINGGDADGNGVDDFCDPDPPQYNGNYPLAGFVWGAVYDVDAQGSDSTLKVRINVDFNFDDWSTAGGGTLDYGVTYHEPPRVLPIQ